MNPINQMTWVVLGLVLGILPRLGDPEYANGSKTPSAPPTGAARSHRRGVLQRLAEAPLAGRYLTEARKIWAQIGPKNLASPGARKRKNPAYAGLLLVAGAGFEPATFGL